MHVAAYIEQHPGSPQTIKQHLAAIKMLFDYLVISQIVPTNPAAPVKGPTHVVKCGKTPVLSVEDARTLLASIPTDSLQGLRDRALIGVMLFSFATPDGGRNNDVVFRHKRVHRDMRPSETSEIQQDRLGVLNLREVNRNLARRIHVKRR